MRLKFWKRNSEDPLVKFFVKKYHVHLLSIPREDASIGDIYVDDNKQVTLPGNITNFLDGFKLPPIKSGEIMADVSGTVSNNINVDVGIGLLEGFLHAFGTGSYVQEIGNNYELHGTRFLRFRFANVTRDTVNVIEFANNLMTSKLLTTHPLYAQGNRYYVVTAIIRSPSISIIAEHDNGHRVDVHGKAMQILDISAGVSVKKSDEGEITYSGRKSLVFGVELHEIIYYPKEEIFKITAVKKYMNLRGSPEDIRKPALIGDTEEGDVFLSIP